MALTEGRVAEMIGAAIQEFEGRVRQEITNQVTAKSVEVAANQQQAITTAIDQMSKEGNAKFTEHEGKVYKLLNQLDEGGKTLERQLDEQRQALVTLAGTDQKMQQLNGMIENINLKANTLNRTTIEIQQSLTDVKTATEKSQVDITNFVNNKMAEINHEQAVKADQLRLELRDWAATQQESIRANLAGLAASATTTTGGGQAHKEASLDKKDVAVWKLPPKVEKGEFRHWCDTVHANFEAIHQLPFPEVIMDVIRRKDTEITSNSWQQVLIDADARVPHNTAAASHGSQAGQGFDGDEPPGIDSWMIQLGSKWKFIETGRFLWTYLLAKLNTELRSLSVSIENKNGFELWRQVVRQVDKLPSNHKFLLGAELSAMVEKFGARVKDLRSAYGFHLLLKKRAAEYKKAVGTAVDNDKLHEILWNALDAGSKLEATRGEAAGSYMELRDHLVNRYNITFGHVEVTKDDPMGIFLVAEREDNMSIAANLNSMTAPAPQQNYNEDHLDPLGKGKGKGKGYMANGGKCNTCGGDGHIGADCPSKVDSNGKLCDDEECFGCHGKGHRSNECPTKNPHLKGKGKGKQGGKWGGGKGWNNGGGYDGGWQVKGKGKGWFGGKGKGKGKGKGGGIYDIDLWGSSSAGSQGDDWSNWSASQPDYTGMRSLCCLSATPTSNRYRALEEAEVVHDKKSEKTIEVPIGDFINRQSKKQEKKAKEHLRIVHRKFSKCVVGCKCGSEELPALAEEKAPPLVEDHRVAQPAEAEIRAADDKSKSSVWGQKGLPVEQASLVTAQPTKVEIRAGQDVPRVAQPAKAEIRAPGKVGEDPRTTGVLWRMEKGKWTASNGIGLPNPAAGESDAARTMSEERSTGISDEVADRFIPIGKRGKALKGTASQTSNSHTGSIGQSKKGGADSSSVSRSAGGVSPKAVFKKPDNAQCRDNCLVKPRLRVIHAEPSSGRSKINLSSPNAVPADESISEAEQAKSFWITEEGQKFLADKYAKGDRHSLNIFDYAPHSKASLSPVSPAEDDWYEVELTADTGACDTVVPKQMCPGIPIVPSMQSQQGMEYEVASGQSIPNLGEKRCEMWTEGASGPRSICMQVADVHKALLSLSRCADMGFESRFGSRFGCLIDTVTGEVTPLQRRGNLYVLRAWIRAAPAAPFGRQEGPR